MSTYLAAVWGPDERAIAASGLAVSWPLADQGRYAGGDTIGALVAVGDTGGDRAALEATELAALGARVWAWHVESRVQKADAEARVTMVALMRRRADLTHEEFVDHWTVRHTPLALRHHVGLVAYTQDVVVDVVTPGGHEIDGIARLGFASRDDLDRRFYDSDDGRAVIGADVREFMAGPGPDTTLFG